MKEDAVEDLSGSRVEAEGHVGETEHGGDAGQVLLDQSDALDGLDPVAARLLHPSRQRERQRVEHEVFGGEAIALDGQVVDGGGGTELPFGGAGLTLFVDTGGHHCRAELARQAQEQIEPGTRISTLFEVHRVEDGSPSEPAQCRGGDRRLGGVDHDRHTRLGGELGHERPHVGHTVGSGVVDADVDDMAAFLDLLLGHRDAGIPVTLEHRLAKLLGAVGIGPLADHKEGRVLLDGHAGIDRRQCRLGFRGSLGSADALDGCHHGGEVGRRGPTAPADGGDTELSYEAGHVLAELLGRQVVVHGTIDDARQTGIGQA